MSHVAAISAKSDTTTTENTMRYMQHARNIALAALALATAAPTVAHAAPPIRQFRFLNSNGTEPGANFNNINTGTYRGQFPALPGQPTFDILCVDFFNSVSNGATYNARIMNLGTTSATDLDAFSRFGSVNLSNYKKAGWLLEQMYNPLRTQADIQRIHRAVWSLNGGANVGLPNAGVQNWINQANAAYTTIGSNSTYWNRFALISDVAMTGPRQGGRLQRGNQEFLHVVPEPAELVLTGTGLMLVGLVATRRRR
ncbi:MAG: PEP-CTERM sorting domain-containing protein [Gemmatimonadales bacterium]|nr:PEP-CTERM sorting domain-containing protein [Gemmatimonadales bacterium]